MRIDALATAVAHRRFLLTALGANFVVVPLVVWALLPIVGDDPAVRLGVVIVLVVPCTDWFITFARLGGGDTALAVIVTPVNLLLQLVLLPLYVRLLAGEAVDSLVDRGAVLTSFVILVVVPFAAATLCRSVAGRLDRTDQIDRAGPSAVPLVASVVFLVTATNAQLVVDEIASLRSVVVVFVVYGVAVTLLATVAANVVRLDHRSARTLLFSVATRNSFVVLPVALALDDRFRITALVVLVQSLVELLVVVLLLRIAPLLLPAAVRDRGS